MSGLLLILKRITPIIMLICCICLGITYTFDRTETQQITYLTHETITVDNRNTETTTDDITIENYTFDFTSYRQNLDIDILKRATQNVLDFDAFQSTLDQFNAIWEDGYKPLAISKTILNAIILVINVFIAQINVIIAPFRIISGILLTGLSILGININRHTPIINLLNAILDQLAIPLINPAEEKSEDPNTLSGTTWQFNNTITYSGRQKSFDMDFYTVEGVAYRYHIIEITGQHNNPTITFYYGEQNQWELTVYQNNVWTYPAGSKIQIATNNDWSEYETEGGQTVYQDFYQWLIDNAVQI